MLGGWRDGDMEGKRAGVGWVRQQKRGYRLTSLSHNYLRNVHCRDFPGGAVVENPPASAGGTGSIPSPGRSHMPWNN